MGIFSGVSRAIFGPSAYDTERAAHEATADKLAIAEHDLKAAQEERDEARKGRDEARKDASYNMQRYRCAATGWDHAMRDLETVRDDLAKAERRLIASLTPAMLRVACDMAGGLDLDEAVRPNVGMARRHLVRALRSAGIIDGADNLTGFGFRAAVAHNSRETVVVTTVPAREHDALAVGAVA